MTHLLVLDLFSSLDPRRCSLRSLASRVDRGPHSSDPRGCVWFPAYSRGRLDKRCLQPWEPFRAWRLCCSDIPDRDGVQVATDRHARGTSPSPSARCQPPRLGSYGPAGAMKLAVDVAGLA